MKCTVWCSSPIIFIVVYIPLKCELCVRVLRRSYNKMLVKSINVKSSVSTWYRGPREEAAATVATIRLDSCFYIEKVNSKPFYWVPVLNVLNFICGTAHIHNWLTDWLTEKCRGKEKERVARFVVINEIHAQCIKLFVLQSSSLGQNE